MMMYPAFQHCPHFPLLPPTRMRLAWSEVRTETAFYTPSVMKKHLSMCASALTHRPRILTRRCHLHSLFSAASSSQNLLPLLHHHLVLPSSILLISWRPSVHFSHPLYCFSHQHHSHHLSHSSSSYTDTVEFSVSISHETTTYMSFLHHMHASLFPSLSLSLSHTHTHTHTHRRTFSTPISSILQPQHHYNHDLSTHIILVRHIFSLSHYSLKIQQERAMTYSKSGKRER